MPLQLPAIDDYQYHSPMNRRVSPATTRGPDGEELTAGMWATLFTDPMRRWMLSTDVGGEQSVRTIWYGLTCTGCSEGFETALIAGDGVVTLLERYSDKLLAVAGPARWVERISTRTSGGAQTQMRAGGA